MKSIRGFLVIVLLAIVTLANFAAALRGYLGSMDEAERLFNQRMLQQVDLLNYTLPQWREQTEAHAGILLFPARAPDAEASLEFQWVAPDGTLLARSAAMPEQVAVPLAEGFRFVNFHHYRWHVLVTPSADKESWFVIAERADQRYRLAESMILQAVYPMVLAIPIIGLIIWWVLGVGLKPVTNLARELRQREATDLRSLDQQDMPAELVQLAQSANDLLRRLDASFAREKRFSGDAAHELRTPIAALKIHCENLLHELQPAPASVMKLKQGIERMSYLVEQILLLNRTAPDHFMGTFETVNLTQLVKQTIVDQSDALELKHHQIEFNGDECCVSGDRAALTSLLNNLLGNAIKYTPAGGRIAINTWLRGRDVVLEVMDNGPGIPAGERERVFDRFYRLGGDRHNSKTPGCGLGLSIVQQVVDLHAAHIALTQSRYGQGLLVMVTFVASTLASTDTHNVHQNKLLHLKAVTDEKIINCIALVYIFFCAVAYAEVPTFTIEIRDHLFFPSQLIIPANTKVKLIVINRDATPEEFESYELNREKVIMGGAKAIIFVGPLVPGDYPFFGEFNPKTAQGTIRVEN